MDIVIIGAGNVAHCFGHLLKLHGHQILQVISRKKENAVELAESLHSSGTDDLLDINMEADLYLMAVSDAAIPELNDELRLGKRFVVHTAGAVPLDAIKKISLNTGVIYPLQSLRKEVRNYPAIPLLLEAANDEVMRRVKPVAQSISPDIQEVNSHQRLQLHLAAVLCNNFTNHLIARAKRYCEKEGLDFTLLQPIIKETFDRLEKFPPETVQTGPAVRNDETTMSSHRALLENEEYLKLIYQVMSDSIYDFHRS
ncbi:Rossmann-like and DUF2520 domain-containing protein [Chitinophaga filiformis]|uniref:Predicted oxidoreductase, contains short-chain dehydrogenase (SDR) and DUF2520 domains n=1 Tax=Chitinophaga filiformis TaxID=104663 RepID=A0A1G7QIR4_CHIFI|nr:Rossmann-like and DUF2520 domain-containing protein [Chitinophaga filiformis]SDF98414.1 Predicted oxidoreductase, contains short-chain dehydrogenase (SDR) and DUF2520 domains [Chitinophaga filiformis]